MHPSQEVPDRDEALAQAAVERLHSDEHVAAGSKLLIRADRVRLAEDLVDVYRRAGANLELVVGRLSWRPHKHQRASTPSPTTPKAPHPRGSPKRAREDSNL